MGRGIPEYLVFDDKRLRSILTNLIYNAIKFTGKNGHVQIKNEYDAASETWTIIVKDNGIGIPAKNRASIFNMFQSLTSQIGGGGGLDPPNSDDKNIVEKEKPLLL